MRQPGKHIAHAQRAVLPAKPSHPTRRADSRRPRQVIRDRRSFELRTRPALRILRQHERRSNDAFGMTQSVSRQRVHASLLATRLCLQEKNMLVIPPTARDRIAREQRSWPTAKAGCRSERRSRPKGHAAGAACQRASAMDGASQAGMTKRKRIPPAGKRALREKAPTNSTPPPHRRCFHRW
jgi:hypothetical protein